MQKFKSKFHILLTTLIFSQIVFAQICFGQLTNNPTTNTTTRDPNASTTPVFEPNSIFPAKPATNLSDLNSDTTTEPASTDPNQTGEPTSTAPTPTDPNQTDPSRETTTTQYNPDGTPIENPEPKTIPEIDRLEEINKNPIPTESRIPGLVTNINPEFISTNCPLSTPLNNLSPEELKGAQQNQNIVCDKKNIIKPAFPYLAFLGPVGAALLFFAISSFLNLTNRNSQRRFAEKQNKINHNNLVDRKSFQSGENLLKFLTDSITNPNQSQTKFNKLISELEIMGSSEIQNLIPNLRGAFESKNPTQIQIATQNLQLLLKKSL